METEAPKPPAPDVDGKKIRFLKSLSAKVGELHEKIGGLAEELSSAKKARDALFREIREVIDDNQMGLEFQEPDTKAPDAPSEPTDGAQEPMEQPAPSDPTAWREMPIERLLLPGNVEKRLKEESFDSLGVLNKFLKKNSLSDIKGIGEKGAEQIEAAYEKFWRDHPGCE